MKTIRSTRFLMTGLMCLLTVASVLFTSVRRAAAAEPVITTVVVEVTTPSPVGESCPGFPVLGTFRSARTSITFYDDLGNRLSEIRHVNFEGMLMNGATGYSVPWDGHFTRTQDFRENTVTFTGLRLRIHIPGESITALRVGKTVLDLSENPPELIFVAGQLEWAEQMCAILSR